MTLIARINKEAFDALIPELQSEYKSDGDTGEFIPDIQGVDGFQLANVSELQNALQLERRKASAAEKALKKFNGPDGKPLDAAKVQAALAKMTEIDAWDPDDKLREHKEAFEQQTQDKAEKEREQLIEKHDQEMADLKTENGTLDKQLDVTLRKNSAITSINKHGGSVRGLLPVIMEATRVVKQDDGKRVVEVIGENGLARLSPTSGKKGTMDIDELVIECKSDKELFPLFKASGASGSGTVPGDSGGAGGGAAATGNPFLEKSWSLTGQANITKADAADSRRLQKEAISKEPEGKAAKMQTMPSAGMAATTT